MPGTDDLESAADRYHHDLLIATHRFAEAARTENPETILAVGLAAIGIPNPNPAEPPCACAVPRLDLQTVIAVMTAMAVQIDTDVPLRERIAWTHQIAAINPLPEPRPSSTAYWRSGGYGGTDTEAPSIPPMAPRRKGLVA